jgi:predicted membrane protein
MGAIIWVARAAHLALSLLAYYKLQYVVGHLVYIPPTPSNVINATGQSIPRSVLTRMSVCLSFLAYSDYFLNILLFAISSSLVFSHLILLLFALISLF